MGKYLRMRLGNWRFAFYFWRIADTLGLNSRVGQDQHILMWDFDGCTLAEVRSALRAVQRKYRLPRIYILESGNPGHFMALSLARVPYRYAALIIADTPYVDLQFWRTGIIRYHWTLRMTAKGRVPEPRLVDTLESAQPEEVGLRELRSWTKYETPS